MELKSLLSFDDDIERFWTEEWKKFCDKVGAMGSVGAFLSENVLSRLTIGSPVILAFVFACAILHFLTGWSKDLGRMLAVHDVWNGSRILQYTSLVTHIFAHSSFGHLKGNMTHLLLVGPSVEHAFGSKNLMIIMGIVAVVSAFAHILLGSNHSHQLGASGVVFACILLSSLVGASYGRIPLSFVIVSALYLGEELALFFNFWNPDGVSHHAHLTGGLVGAAAGFYIHEQRRRVKTKKVVQQWLAGRGKKTVVVKKVNQSRN